MTLWYAAAGVFSFARMHTGSAFSYNKILRRGFIFLIPREEPVLIRQQSSLVGSAVLEVSLLVEGSACRSAGVLGLGLLGLLQH